MSKFQKLSTGVPRGATVQGTDIGSGAATSSQFLAADGSAGSAYRLLASADLPTISLTSDVTGSASAGSISTTIANNAVTNAKFRQSSGLSVVGNSTNSTANVADITGTTDQVLRISSAGTSLGFGAINLAASAAVSGTLSNTNTTATSANTASAIVARDANKNFQTNMVEEGVTTTATSGTTTTLTVSSTPTQEFTGSTTQNVALPDATTLNNGHWYSILNASTGAVTIKNNGASTLATVSGNSRLDFVLISNGTTNGTWDFISNYGNAISALTGDVTATGPGSVGATIANNAVTNAKFRQSAGLSVVGNSTSSTANVADITGTANQVLVVNSGGTSLGFGAVNLASGSAVTGTLANGNTTATNNATVSTIMSRDTNANSRINSIIQGFTTTATAGTSTTLTVSSTWAQQFTGSTTQTVVLPDATTLVAGESFFIMNRSSGVVTVNANGGGLVQTMAAGSQTMVTVTAVGTSAGSWDSAYSTTSSSGSSNPTTNGTRGSPNSITAGTGLSSSFVSTTALVQVVFVQGSGGAVTITATPAIVAGTIVGQVLYIIGRSLTNTLTIPNQSGQVELNGPCTLGLEDTLSLIWDGTAWAETARNT